MTSQPPIRSELSVPGGKPRLIEKALASPADSFFVDLEDSVAPGQKDAARSATADALVSLDWGNRPRRIRINQIDSPWCLPDLIELLGRPESIDRIVVPKVRNAGDIAYLDRIVRQVGEVGGNDTNALTYEVQIEDANGWSNLDAILAESNRIAVVTFGQGDFAASTGMPAREIGVSDVWDAAVRGDRWLFPRQQIVFSAARKGIQALNGPYAAYTDTEGFWAYCRMSRAIGFAGGWCIHPNQIAIANDVFSPSPEDITHAEAVVSAVEAGWQNGVGAISRNQFMTDEASVRMAKAVLAQSRADIGNAKTGDQ